MLRSIQQRDLDRNRWIKVTMGVILGLIIVSMVITLIPGLMNGTTGSDAPDAIASVGGQNITIVDFQQRISAGDAQSGNPSDAQGGLLEANPRSDDLPARPRI